MPDKISAKRRYTSDHLIYEAFYIALRNSLIVSLTPVVVFVFLAAVCNYDMNKPLTASIVRLVEIIFVLGFFINFFYYAYFIRLKRVYAYGLTVLTSCGLAFLIFFSDYKNALRHEHEAIIVGCWFLLLAILMIANRTGLGRDVAEKRYDEESWLYKHALSQSRQQEDEADEDHEEKYRHRYVDTDVYASDAYDDEPHH